MDTKAHIITSLGGGYVCLPGVILEATCPKCGRLIKRDLGKDPLINPVFNQPLQVGVPCPSCWTPEEEAGGYVSIHLNFNVTIQDPIDTDALDAEVLSILRGQKVVDNTVHEPMSLKDLRMRVAHDFGGKRLDWSILRLHKRGLVMWVFAGLRPSTHVQAFQKSWLET